MDATTPQFPTPMTAIITTTMAIIMIMEAMAVVTEIQIDNPVARQG
jgi:hypothetical protein